MRHLEDFFAFAEEREHIRLRREAGQPPPWTDDSVLGNCFFCNVYREDDKLTRWFRENIRDAVSEDTTRAVIACVAFRWFNYQPTGEILKPYLLGNWVEYAIRAALQEQKQVVGGAYLIKSPAGRTKADGLIDCMQPIVRAARDLGWAAHRLHYSLEQMHSELMVYPYLGRFMAYEVVTDLRHTAVLRRAKDIDTWASAGPGCARGLGWVTKNDPSAFSYASRPQQQAMLGLMRQILAASRSRWPWPNRPWEMREVEHVLCEFSKYRMAQSGKRVKRRFDAHNRHP